MRRLVFPTLLLLTGAFPALAGGEPAQILPPKLQDIGIDQKLGAQIPLDLTFKDETGQAVKLGQYFDGRRPVILTLVYYECPMLCTLVLNDTVRAMRAMNQLSVGKDFQIVTVSFNPKETPELAARKKANYVGEYRREGAEAGWHFLTGEEENIRKLTDAVGFRYKYDEKFKEYVHPSGIFVLTPSGQIARYFFGIGYEPKDLRLSLVEASNNQIGSLTEQLLLFCYHYDASTGKYSLAVMRAVQVGGVLILIAVGTMFYLLSHRKRPPASLQAAPGDAKSGTGDASAEG